MKTIKWEQLDTKNTIVTVDFKNDKIELELTIVQSYVTEGNYEVEAEIWMVKEEQRNEQKFSVDHSTQDDLANSVKALAKCESLLDSVQNVAHYLGINSRVFDG